MEGSMHGAPGAADPHGGRPVREAGAPLTRARAAVVMVHGRGATAESILELADVLAQPEAAYLAPAAAGNTWYPYSFLAPLQANEPFLGSALRAVDSVVARVAAAGLPSERTVLLGFSQGACLAAEFAARNARRYGGLVILSGGLVGTSDIPGATSPADKEFDYASGFDGTPVLLGCSDIDPHIPVARVRRTAEVLASMGARVTERIYPGMGHTVNEDEIRWVRGLLAGLVEEG
jgi:predicted esterase